MESLNLKPPAITDSAVAGEAAKTRQQLEQLIKKVNTSSFDIGELLHIIKKNSYYTEFVTFQEYIKTLDIKPRKAQYLRRIAQVADELGIPRAKYEPLGTAKMREITSLDTGATWVNPETKEELPIKDFIYGFIEKGETMGLEEIKAHVKTLKGLVGAEAMGWVHLYMKQIAIDNTVKPALDLAKAQIGSVSKDDEGMSQDASDGQAAEAIFADYLSGSK
jgi:hypothetical protein